MQIKRKPTAVGLAVAYVVWQAILQPIWNLNIERVAQQENLDKALSGGWGMVSALHSIAAYVPSSFGGGFVVGALLFAYWDGIVGLFRRHVLRQESASKIRAWVGSIMPYYDPKDSGMELRISIVNIGDLPFRVSCVSGNIRMKYDPGTTHPRTVELPTPTLKMTEDHALLVEPYFILNLYLVQAFPPEVDESFPDAFGWRPHPALSLQKLRIVLTAPNGQAKELTLWDSMRLSAGEGVVRAEETFRVFKSDEAANSFRGNLRSLAARLDPNR